MFQLINQQLLLMIIFSHKLFCRNFIWSMQKYLSLSGCRFCFMNSIMERIHGFNISSVYPVKPLTRALFQISIFNSNYSSLGRPLLPSYSLPSLQTRSKKCCLCFISVSALISPTINFSIRSNILTMLMARIMVTAAIYD